MRQVMLAGLFCFVAVSGRANDVKNQPALKIDGVYQIVSGEKDGKRLPADHWAGAVVTINGDKIYGTDKDKKEFFACLFKIDATKKPFQISMVSTNPKVGDKADGLIKVDGDMVTIAYNLPGGLVPTEFKGGEKQHLFVLKKVK
ncbi:TIGR03067 domain-containing protein [Zavarzinella formosa]|uniref:TIGR03067 domain-containing protein n=1 Tax=Zavarzinella formosa TaxID=360055 RepID=UPI00030C6921|nr:TIGR03067 domain-containing protein [Zavarzinella formosa]